MQKPFLTMALLAGLTVAATAQTKTIHVRLNGIFMNECGNTTNHCTHEPVSGSVQAFIAANTPTGVVMVPRTQQLQEYIIWKNSGYDLVCYNIHTRMLEQGNPSMPRTPIANNIWQSFYYQISQQEWLSNTYQLRLKLSLGNRHQDNPFASVGEHWTDDVFPTLDFRSSGNGSGYSELKTFGPFKTYSDRCHEYWVQFQVDVN